MDCAEFDGQVVRLEKIKDIADQFVRVRLTRIDNTDLNLFEFDYDLTFMVFFMDAKEKVYARYGGRDSRNADNRQSLEGLRYTMQSVAAMHQASEKQYAPRVEGKPVNIREIPGAGRGGKCLHCHQVKERLQRKGIADGTWKRHMVYRYPLPDNLGFRLDVNRSNVVAQVTPESPAAKAGLKAGDVVRQLGNVPIHSFGDATYALDKAPTNGKLNIAWSRDKEPATASLDLPNGWRKTDVSWRPSLRRMIPTPPFSGDDLNAAQRKQFGLSDKQLALRLTTNLRTAAKKAGFQAGDIVVSVDDRQLELTSSNFGYWIQAEYLVGDTLHVTVLRDGKKLKLPLALTAR